MYILRQLDNFFPCYIDAKTTLLIKVAKYIALVRKRLIFRREVTVPQWSHICQAWQFGQLGQSNPFGLDLIASNDSMLIACTLLFVDRAMLLQPLLLHPLKQQHYNP